MVKIVKSLIKNREPAVWVLTTVTRASGKTTRERSKHPDKIEALKKMWEKHEA